MCKFMSLSYYFNILEVGFVVLGGLMIFGGDFKTATPLPLTMILIKQKRMGSDY